MKYFLKRLFFFGRKINLTHFGNKIVKPFLYRKHKYRIHNNILLEEYKAIYFNVPKVASSSLKKVFTQILELENTDESVTKIHKTNFPYVKMNDLGYKYRTYFKFAFVRNPYDRLVSCYKNRILKEKINDDVFINGVHGDFFSLGNFYAGMSFKEFIKEISKIEDKDSDPHFRSQNLILSYSGEKIELDFIGKFEKLSTDFKKLQDIIGIKNKIKLPHLMKSGESSYNDYYDEESKKIVQDRYKKDFELYGYKF